MNSTNWPGSQCVASHLSWFAPVSRRSRVRIPLKPWYFSTRLLPSNCLNWKIYCDDHSSLSSTTAVQYEFLKKKTFARRWRAVIIYVHFFPFLGNSATWNDHYSSYKENRNTQARIWIFSPSLDTASLNSVWVVLLRCKSHTNWDNDKKDSKTWTCNFERRFRYRCVVDVLRSNFKNSLKLPKQRRQQRQRQKT